MKRYFCLFIGVFLVMTTNAITEQEAKQIVVRYYNLLTEVSKTSDTKYGARNEIGEMFIHKDGWIFNDIEYKINKRPQEKGDPIDTYIISMAGANLFGAQFTPSGLTAIKKVNDWQINYNMHVYKQNVANYNISLLMHLDPAGKIRYIEKYNKIEEKIRIESFKFSVQDKSGNISSMGLLSAHQNLISNLTCNLTLCSNIERDIKILHKIYAPDGIMWTCSNCNNVPKGYTVVTSTHIYTNKSNNCKQSMGCSDGNCWEQGKYIWEVWTDKGLLGSKSFEILPPKQNDVVDFLKITNIEFIGLDKDGYEITKPVKEGGVMSSYKKIKGIKVKLYYTKLSKDININVVFDINDKLRSNYYHNWDYTLEKNTTQESINIKYNNMPQNGKAKIELTTKTSEQGKAKTKSYNYYIVINN